MMQNAESGTEVHVYLEILACEPLTCSYEYFVGCLHFMNCDLPAIQVVYSKTCKLATQK